MMNTEERRMLAHAIARMRSRIMATSCAVVCGSLLFIATALHLPRDRAPSSLDIGLLSNYLPGYSVSWGGALLGLVYGAVAGALVGGGLVWGYNRLVRRDPSA